MPCYEAQLRVTAGVPSVMTARYVWTRWLLFAGALLGGGATALIVAEAAAAAPRHAATCDEAPGVTVRTSERWRLFRPHPSGEFDSPGSIWVCRRDPGPAHRFAELDFIFRSVITVAGDLAHISNSGRYNPESYLLDLATLRYTVVSQDSPSSMGSLLTGSGAVSSWAASRTFDPATGGIASAHDPVTVDDAAGRHEVLAAEAVPAVAPGATPSPVAGAAGSADPAVAVSEEGDAVSGVVYASRTDGSPVRYVATGSPSTAGWKAPRSRYFRKTFRVRSVAGQRTTPIVGSDHELRARRAKRGHRATLTLREPSLIAYDDDPPKHPSDLVARLAPGSESDVRVHRGVVTARFADQPSEVRTRLPGKGGSSLVDLTGVPASEAGPIATSNVGATAIAGADFITLVVPDARTGVRSVSAIPAPGASQLAMYFVSAGRAYDHVLYWTDAAGNPQRFTFSAPA